MWSSSLLLLLTSTIVLTASTVSRVPKDGPTKRNLHHVGIDDQFQASSLPHKRVKRVNIKEVSALAPGEYESTKKIVEDCLTELKENKTRVEAELATARAQLTVANGNYEKAEKDLKDEEEKIKSEEEQFEDEEPMPVNTVELQNAVESAALNLQAAQIGAELYLGDREDKYVYAQELLAEYAKTRRDFPGEIDALKTKIDDSLRPAFNEKQAIKQRAEEEMNFAINQQKQLNCDKPGADVAGCATWKREERAARSRVSAAREPLKAALKEKLEAERSVLEKSRQLTKATTGADSLTVFVEAWDTAAQAEKLLKEAKSGGGKMISGDQTAFAKMKVAAYEKTRNEVQAKVTSLEKELADLDGEITKGQQQIKGIQQKIDLSKAPPKTNIIDTYLTPAAYAFIAISMLLVALITAKIWHNERKKKKNKKAVMNLPKPFRYKIPQNSNKGEGSGSDSSSNIAQPSTKDSKKGSGSDSSSNVAQPSIRDSKKETPSSP